MVYYLTSGNVRMLRNIIIDYTGTVELSAYEYMKTYIEKCPETTEDSKVSWIAKSFLGIQKHGDFLKEITVRMSDELTKEDMDYFIIIFHAVIFQIEPKEMNSLYKCLFNLSKPLLDTFTKFLSNNEVLTFISQVAETDYDTIYITDKIIGPLFIWQPYISEMAHNFAEYVKKTESRKIKPLTIPVQPNVLNRKGKDQSLTLMQLPLAITPPNSICTKSKRMLTKSTIDERLRKIHEKNKLKATHLLNNVRNNNYNYAQDKTDKNHRKSSGIHDEVKNQYTVKTFKKSSQPIHMESNTPSVKETAATLKRLNKRVQLAEEQELEWLQTLMTTCRNTTKIEEIKEHDRQEKERERLLDIEKKHLMGQISYEEALIAKKKLQEDNKKKYKEFVKEKEIWNEQLENWRKCEMERNRKQVEKLSMMELNLIQAKNGVVMKKKERAEKLKKESEILLAESLKEKQQELEYRINMIKEIKILSIIAKKAKVPKIIDLTETSGLGLLCEMSIAELQERLSALKIGLNEELEKKKKSIKEEKSTAKEDLEEAKKSIKRYMMERAISRSQNKKVNNVNMDTPYSKEISDLKKMLEDKRKLRLHLARGVNRE